MATDACDMLYYSCCETGFHYLVAYGEAGVVIDIEPFSGIRANEAEMGLIGLVYGIYAMYPLV